MAVVNFADEVSSVTEEDSPPPPNDPYGYNTDDDIDVHLCPSQSDHSECDEDVDDEYIPSQTDHSDSDMDYENESKSDVLIDSTNTVRNNYNSKSNSNDHSKAKQKRNRNRIFNSNRNKNRNKEKVTWSLHRSKRLKKDSIHWQHTKNPRKRTKSKPNLRFLSAEYNKLPQPLRDATGNIGDHGSTTAELAQQGYLSAFQIWVLQWRVPQLDKDLSNFSNKRAKKKKIKQWKLLTIPLLFMLLIVKLYMGLIYQGTVSDYWDPKDGSETIKSIFSRDVYKMYSPNVCLYDVGRNYTVSDHRDTGYKGSYCWDQFSNCATKYLDYSSDLSVDERVIDWKGRFNGKVKIKTKKHKEGLKIMQVCENSGYTYKAKLHTLSWLADMKKKYPNRRHTIGGRVILSLIDEGRIPSGTAIHHDNYFTNYHAIREAYEKNIWCNGPARARSNGSAFYKLKTMQYNNHDFYHMKNDQNPIINTGVQDGSSFFHILSSLPHDWTRTKKARDPTVPYTDPNYNTPNHPQFTRCINNHLYIEHMGGVDLSNQYSNAYSCNRKAAKWITKSFQGFLDLTVTNAIILYNKTTAGQKYSHNGRIKKFKKITKREMIKHIAKVGLKPFAELYLTNYRKWARSRVTENEEQGKQRLKERFKPRAIRCVYVLMNEKEKYHKNKNKKRLSNRVINNNHYDDAHHSKAKKRRF